MKNFKLILVSVIVLIATLQTLFSQKFGPGYQFSFNKAYYQHFFFLTFTDEPISFSAGKMFFVEQEKHLECFYIGQELYLLDFFLKKKSIFTVKIGSNLFIKKEDLGIFFTSSFGIKIRYVNVDLMLLSPTYKATGECIFTPTKLFSFGIKTTLHVPLKKRDNDTPRLQ